MTTTLKRRGQPPKERPRQTVCVRLDPDIHDALRRYVTRTGLSQSAAINLAIKLMTASEG